MSKTIGLILVALGLSTGLAFAQQGGDYQRSNPAAPETVPMPSATKPEPTPAPGVAGTISQQAANQIRTRELIGAKAVHEGSDVGNVDDLLVEEKNGKVVGVVLSVGGVFGVGDKLVAVPWEQIDLIKGEGHQPILYLAMSEEQLEVAPYFEPSKLD
jgi:sporulation protein YlmC with PRC-barrel domain